MKSSVAGDREATTTRPLHLAVALDGAGWHPAAWREPSAHPAGLLTAGYWIDLVRTAEAGRIDFVTFEDTLGPPGDRTDRVQGRLDAVLIAARVAPATRHIGLVPTATVTHTEPFHLAKAIATLDYVSAGRAGWRVRVSGRPDEAAHFGRRDPGSLTDLAGEAADYVEVVRRLWDSWEDDAEIRDAATGRFIDRDKLHYIDFAGRYFRVKGPSITPRPPQGQPLVTAPGEVSAGADLAYLAGDDPQHRPAAAHLFGDLVVFLAGTETAARDVKHRLDEWDGAEYTADTPVFTGTPGQLADLLLSRRRAGLTGFRLHPGRLPADLEAITGGLVPELQARGAFRRAYEPATLRGRLGLPRPANRYAQESHAQGVPVA